MIAIPVIPAAPRISWQTTNDSKQRSNEEVEESVCLFWVWELWKGLILRRRVAPAEAFWDSPGGERAPTLMKRDSSENDFHFFSQTATRSRCARVPHDQEIQRSCYCCFHLYSLTSVFQRIPHTAPSVHEFHLALRFFTASDSQLCFAFGFSRQNFPVCWLTETHFTPISMIVLKFYSLLKALITQHTGCDSCICFSCASWHPWIMKVSAVHKERHNLDSQTSLKKK